METVARVLQDSIPSSLMLNRKPTPNEANLFTEVLQPLDKVFRPPLDSGQVLVYFQLLADLPAEALYAAALEIAASRVYPTWPTPGEIRTVATRLLSPQLTAGEAWQVAQRAARRLADENLDYKNGMPSAEWNQHVWDALPPAVAITLRIFGGRRLLESQATYANFRDEYERQVACVRRPSMLPAPLKEVIAKLAATVKVFDMEPIAGKIGVAS